MKIQSRPPVDATPAMTTNDMSEAISVMLELHGSYTSDLYRKVLATGAMEVLRQQGHLLDFAVCNGGRGRFGVHVDFQMPDGEYSYISL